MPRSRRSLLRLCAASLSVAGCSGADGPGQAPSPSRSPSPSSSPSPSPTAECEATEPPQPTPTAEGFEPLSYLGCSESLTAESAREFVVEYERAYRHNRFLAENFVPGTDLVLVDAGVPDGCVTGHGDGYPAGVDATIATEDNRRPTVAGTATPTQGPSYDDEFAAWYRLTPRRVRRKEAGTDLPETPDDVDTSDMTTVLCVRASGVRAVGPPTRVSGRHPGPA